jgi:hypothetical protein
VVNLYVTHNVAINTDTKDISMVLWVLVMLPSGGCGLGVKCW